MNRFAKKLRMLWHRRQLERDLDDELRFHLAMKTEEAGDPVEAERRLGNAIGLKEDCRAIWTFATLETWWQDIRYAIRTLGRTPGFVAAATVALALGIGADTAIFTIATGALTWDLGLDHVDRIVLVNLTDTTRGQGFGMSYPDFRDFRSQTKSLTGLAAYQFASVNLSDNRSFPERCWRARMSANGFFVSEQKPAIGRIFSDDDERPGAPAVVVLSHHVWQERYAGDPAILGKTVRVDDVPSTIIGVMPPAKRFPEDADLWTPLVPDTQLEQRTNRSVAAFGRLSDGADISAARTEFATIARRIAAQYPATNKGLTADVRRIAEITGVYNMRPLFVVLWLAAGFVLTIACADVANMLLARGAARRREIAIRVAIGAGRTRIVRQLLIETVLMAVAGGCLGWFVALGGLRWFDAGTGGMVKPVWLNLTLDRTAFAYLAGVSILTGILFGLAPALRLAQIDVHSAMKDGGQGVTGSRRLFSMSNLLVGFQMALCMVLMAGAGLLIRSAINLYAAPVGVDVSNVLTMRVNLPEAHYRLPSDQVAFHRTLKNRLEALPGVAASATVSRLPFGGFASFPCEVQGAHAETGRVPYVGAMVVGADYFKVMRAQPRRGRVFTESDGIAGAPVALVNETFAAIYWPGHDALGKQLRLLLDHTAQPWLTVVGVVPDILQNFRRPLDHDALIYLPYAADPQREIYVVSRTLIPPAQLAGGFRRAVQAVDPNLAVYEVRTLENRLAEKRLSAKLLGGTFSVFAVIALVLAALGLYSVIAHSISQRTQEIGVRMALGGTRQDIARLVFVQGMRPMLLGMAPGLPAALAVTHVLRMVLIGVSPGDPLTFLLAVLVLAGAGVLGCAIPARRAIGVDPMVALRYE